MSACAPARYNPHLRDPNPSFLHSVALQDALKPNVDVDMNTRKSIVFYSLGRTRPHDSHGIMHPVYKRGGITRTLCSCMS